MTEKTFKVFLCSTYSDLIKEREDILQVIQRLQLLHSSMECFGARPEAPLEVVLEEVRASDIVVVIVGHRYGTLVPGKKISYTETEYREAWNNDKSCLVYLRSDDMPILPTHVERDPFGIKALEKFKKLLQSRHLTVSFSHVENIAVHVAVDLERILKSKKQEPPQEPSDSSLSLLDFLNTPSFICNTDNLIISANKTLIKTLGYSLSEIIGKSLAKFIDDANNDWWVKNSISYFPDKEQRYTQQGFKKKDGHIIYFELDILKYELGGNSVFQCVGRDITERRLAEIELVKYSKQMEKQVEVRDRALREYQKQTISDKPLDKILRQAEKAYKAYMAAERNVAHAYHESQTQIDNRYKKDEQKYNYILSQSLHFALEDFERSQTINPLDEYELEKLKDAIRQAVATHNRNIEKIWIVRSETIQQAWAIYSKMND